MAKNADQITLKMDWNCIADFDTLRLIVEVAVEPVTKVSEIL